MGIAEETANEMPNLRAAGLIPLNERAEDVGTAILVVSDVPFFLEDPDGRENRVVGESRLRLQPVQNLLHRSLSLVPEHLHDAQFRFGERF